MSVWKIYAPGERVLPCISCTGVYGYVLLFGVWFVRNRVHKLII